MHPDEQGRVAENTPETPKRKRGRPSTQDNAEVSVTLSGTTVNRLTMLVAQANKKIAAMGLPANVGMYDLLALMVTETIDAKFKEAFPKK